MISMESRQNKFYFAASKISEDEDLTHEFKGHINFTKEQVPPFACDSKFDRPTRQPISKTVNAFLNSGHGGTIYLGVADNGHILGIMLNQYKIDHILLNVKDMMGRYLPPVDSHRYDIQFVPVLHQTATEHEIQSALVFDPSVGVDTAIRMKPHSLRSYRYCWCDMVLAAQTAHGILCLPYVIEIFIKPWTSNDVFNTSIAVGKMKAQPIHENEEIKAYYRGGASIREFTIAELQAFGSNAVLEHYQVIKNKKKHERSELIRRLPSALTATA